MGNKGRTLYHKCRDGTLKEQDISVKLDAINWKNSDEEDMTPLHVASALGRQSAVEILLQNKAEVNATDKYYRTPLHWASNNGHELIVALLLAHKANINFTNGNGNTPLHIAAYNGGHKVIDVLVRHEADVNLKNNKGNDALAVAEHCPSDVWPNDKLQVIQYLLNAKNLDGRKDVVIEARSDSQEVQESRSGQGKGKDAIRDIPFGITTKTMLMRDNPQMTFKQEHILIEPGSGDLVEELLTNFEGKLSPEDIEREMETISTIIDSKPDQTIELKSNREWKNARTDALLALRLYTDSKFKIYEIINKILRDRVSNDESVKNKAKKDIENWKHFIYNLQCAIINLPGTDSRETLYRGLSVIPDDLNSIFQSTDEIIVWTSFTSCSRNRKVAEDFAKGKVLFEIEVHEGQGAFLEEFTMKQGELELLLPAFCQFKILFVERQMHGFELFVKLECLYIETSTFTIVDSQPPSTAYLHKVMTNDNQRIVFHTNLTIDWKDLEIQEEIGEGTFGLVHKGLYNFEEVAIKVIGNMRSSSISTFKSEVALLAHCHNSYITQLKGACFEPGRYCIVMEYLAGGSLQTYLSEHKQKQHQSPLKTRYLMGCDIACGVAYLHSKNIIHSDIKSGNVLLTEHYRAKISDLGVSKLKKASGTTILIGNVSIGTALWTAPEVEDNDQPTSKESDMFSVGMVLWELLSFETPFYKCQTEREYWDRTQNGKKEDIPPNSPKEISSLISSCWSSNPIDRPTAVVAVQMLFSELPSI